MKAGLSWRCSEHSITQTVSNFSSIARSLASRTSIRTNASSLAGAYSAARHVRLHWAEGETDNTATYVTCQPQSRPAKPAANVENSGPRLNSSEGYKVFDELDLSYGTVFHPAFPIAMMDVITPE